MSAWWLRLCGPVSLAVLHEAMEFMSQLFARRYRAQLAQVPLRYTIAGMLGLDLARNGCKEDGPRVWSRFPDPGQYGLASAC